MRLTDKFENKPGVYIIRNGVNGKYYIGETMDVYGRMKHHRHDKSQIIHRAFKKYGKDNFDVEVYYLPDFKKQDLIDLEEQLIIKYNSIYPTGYNILYKGVDRTGFTHTDEAKQIMREKALGRKHSDESKLKMSLSRKGKTGTPCTEERKIKMAEERRGIKLSEEHKQKISLGLTGKKMSPEAIEKRVQSFSGFKHSDECKQRMSELKKGTKMSDEAKKNMSIARSGENHHNYGKKVSEKERIRLSTLRLGVPSEFKGKKHSEQSRKNMSEGAKRRTNHRSGFSHTKETREKISKSKIGKKMPPRSEETQKKITEGILKTNKWKGENPHLVKPRKPKKALTEEGRINMSNAQKGRISNMKGKQMSEESKLKMSIFAKKRVRTPHSEETKQKMRDAYIRRKGQLTP